MNAVWLIVLGSLLVGSALVAVIETQGSSGASDGAPGLIGNVREIAQGVDDDLGGAVGGIGDFLTGVPDRLGLGGDDSLVGGEFVPPVPGGSGPLHPAELALLLELPQQVPIVFAPPAAEADAASKKQELCQETGSGSVTLELPDRGASAHLEKGDESGACGAE
jgi:hypothetical protein